jgi:hypothetical protein
MARAYAFKRRWLLPEADLSRLGSAAGEDGSGILPAILLHARARWIAYTSGSLMIWTNCCVLLG